MGMINTIGRHYVVEASGCNPEVINDMKRVEEILVQAAKQARASVVTTAFHRFYPQGVSGVVVVSESHIAVHTWPEKGYAALDIYTCGDHTMPDEAVKYVLKEFGATSAHITYIVRGLESEEKKDLYLHELETKEERLDNVKEKLDMVL
jgi:S-adenosylmethionine decarboxylase